MNHLTIENGNVAHLKFTARWHDAVGEHRAVEHVEKFTVWRDLDLLPADTVMDLHGRVAGEQCAQRFAAGALLPEWKPEMRFELPRARFTGRLRSGQSIAPRAGRFYPKGMVSSVNGYFSEDFSPMRFVQPKDNAIELDFNHPLSRENIALSTEVVTVSAAESERGGRCVDVPHTLFDGPGMQLPDASVATDFFYPEAFQRVDERLDALFYEGERMVHHLDAVARRNISDLYAELIQPGDQVLDLMSSWESHLPDGLDLASLVGLGMNEAELKANPRLTGYQVQDLNASSVMDFADESFDVVICTASVEYLTQPLKVFAEVQRILKPGGRFVVAFSNRWFPPKSILLWSELHDFERLGLVVEYFRQSGWTDAVNTLTLRGQSRPEDDPHYLRSQRSDPLYAAWSTKPAVTTA